VGAVLAAEVTVAAGEGEEDEGGTKVVGVLARFRSASPNEPCDPGKLLLEGRI